jgi:hypothetical protein
MQSDGKPDTVYLTKESNVYAVTVGDLIEGTYRVLDVSGDRLEVTYLPLGAKQQIPFLSIVAAAQPQGITNTYVNPGLPPSVNSPVPAPFNLAPMFETARPGDPAAQPPGRGGAQRGGGDQAAGNPAASAGQQAPANPAAPSAAPGSQPAVAAPGLIPTPVVVSPPSFSGFGPPPANPNASGSAPTPGGPAAAPGSPVAVPPNDPGSVPGGVPINDMNPSGATSGGNAGSQVGVPNTPAASGR